METMKLIMGIYILVCFYAAGMLIMKTAANAGEWLWQECQARRDESESGDDDL